MSPATRRARARRGEGERLREEILAAAERLLIETGDEGAGPIWAIAEAAGVTPPVHLPPLPRQDRLLGAVCEARFQEFDRDLEEAVAGIEDPLDARWARGRAYVRFGLDHPEHYRICS